MKLFTVYTVAILTLCLSLPVQADEEAKIDANLQALIDKEGKLSPRGILEGHYFLWKRVGLWAELYGKKGHVSLVAGPYVELFTFGHDAKVETGLAGGAELSKSHDDHGSHARELNPLFAGFVYAGNEAIFLKVHYEMGLEGGGQARAVLHWQAFDRLAFQGLHQTGDGNGGGFEIPVNERARIQAALLSKEGLNFKESTVFVGMNLNLQ